MDAEGHTNGTSELNKFDFESSDFSRIITTSAYVDKSMLIKAVLEGKSELLIAAPRKFGKSTNMNMVKRFLEIVVDDRGTPQEIEETTNYKLFKDNEDKLEICKNVQFFKEHFGQYPVLFINFKPLESLNGYKSTLGKFGEILRDTLNQHRYLLHVENLWVDQFDKEEFNSYLRNGNVNKAQIINGFAFLAKVMHKHFKKQVFIMIDQSDAPIASNLVKTTKMEFEKILYFFRSFLYALFENNPDVNRAFLTGVSLLLVTAVTPKRFAHCSFCGRHDFVPFYGFTDGEVKMLLKKFKMSDKLDIVTQWYGGYRALGPDKDFWIYNSWSVAHYLKEKTVKRYW